MGFQSVDLSEQKFMLSPEREASSRLDRAMQKARCLWPSKTPVTKRLIISLWTNAENRLHDNILWWHLRREISGITRGLSTLQRLAGETDDAGDKSKYVKVMGPPPPQSATQLTFCLCSQPPFFCPSNSYLHILTLVFQIVPNNVWLIEGWHKLFCVIFPQGACIFFQRYKPCLTILFLPYHLSQAWESRRHFIHDNLQVNLGDIHCLFNTVSYGCSSLTLGKSDNM